MDNKKTPVQKRQNKFSAGRKYRFTVYYYIIKKVKQGFSDTFISDSVYFDLDNVFALKCIRSGINRFL